jgi:hypothetical protein
MVSTASHTGRVLFRHERENDEMEKEFAAEEASLRARLDREHNGVVADARAASSRPAPSGGRAAIRRPGETERIATLDAELAKLHDRHAAKRRPQRDRHIRELQAARNVQTTSAKHIPQAQPAQHEPIFQIWPNLNAARREAIAGVYRRYAALRDNTDADLFTQARSAGRYMTPGSAITNVAHDRMETAHLDLCRKEYKELLALAVRFEADIEADRRRVEQHARERADLAAQQSAETRAHR